MATNWIETITGSLEQKKQYRQYKARIEALQLGMVAVAWVALLGLFPTRRLPGKALQTTEITTE